MSSLLATLPNHSHQVVGACVSYFALFWVLSPILSARLAPSLYSKLPRRSKINWDVRVVSFIQAAFICTSAIRVILTDESRNELDATGRLRAYSPMAGRVQAFAAGYFLWDLLISLQYLRILGSASLLHAISALLVTMTGFRPFANYYGINFVLYELSTPFLNIHWVLDKSGLTGSTWQLVNGIVLMASFFGCRIIWGWYQSINLYRDVWSSWATNCSDKAHLGAQGVESYCQTFDVWLTLLFLAANTILSILNLYWFGLMVKALRKRFR